MRCYKGRNRMVVRPQQPYVGVRVYPSLEMTNNYYHAHKYGYYATTQTIRESVFTAMRP